MESNSAAYVSRMLDGDVKAFGAFYEATSKRVYFICISFLKNEHDAKDIMQDVYLSAWQKLHLLEDAEKVQGWLERIAVNKCKDYLKRNTPIPTEEEALEGILPAEEELQFSEEYITNSEKRRVIMEIMRTRISDLQYQTVILYYFNELSIRETAEIMECSEGAVKNRLSEARKKIRKGIEEYEKTHETRLYGAVPLLTLLLQGEARSVKVPDLSEIITSEIMKLTGKGAVKAAGRAGIPLIEAKYIAAAAAILIASGGAGTAAVLHSQNQDDSPEQGTWQAILPETVTETITPVNTETIVSAAFTSAATETAAEETATTIESTATTRQTTFTVTAPVIQTTTAASSIPTESTSAEPETYEITRETIIKGYRGVLEALRCFDDWDEKFAINGEDEKGTYPLEFQYTLFDMDQNGVPELIVLYGLHVYAEAVSFYTFDESGVRYLGDGGGYASGFHYDTEAHQFVIGSGHMGVYWYDWYTIENGRVTEAKHEDLNIIREDKTGPDYYDDAYWEEWMAEQHLADLDTACYHRATDTTSVWTYQNSEAQNTEFSGFDCTFLESYPY